MTTDRELLLDACALLMIATLYTPEHKQQRTDVCHALMDMLHQPEPQFMTDITGLAKWMIANSYATGHGDTVEDLARELRWQVAEECAKVVGDEMDGDNSPSYNRGLERAAAAIRAKFCGKGEL